MRIALCGLGKTGGEVAKAVCARDEDALVLGVCRAGSDKQKMTLGEVFELPGVTAPVVETGVLEDALGQTRPDVLIDFSEKQATLEMLPVLGRAGVPIVVCTTGFSPDELALLRQFGEDGGAAVAYAPNVTLGINVLMALAYIVAKLLPRYDYRITEVHHAGKADPISGTAYKIEEALQSALTKTKKIPIKGVREGNRVGYHEVKVQGAHERITISHESLSREAFADGALMAAGFIAGKRGYYEMRKIVRQRLAEEQIAL